jgi:pseudomonalisin
MRQKIYLLHRYRGSLVLLLLLIGLWIGPKLLPTRVVATVGAQDRPALMDIAQPPHPALRAAVWQGALAPDTKLSLIMVLRMPERQKVADFAQKLHDPQSPHYRKWLTPTQVGNQFGVNASRYNQIANWLQTMGFQKIYTWPNRLAINFQGSVAQIEQIFHLRLSRYQQEGKEYYANEQSPQIPTEFFSDVEAILGLENFSEPLPQHINAGKFSPTTSAVATEDLKIGFNTAIAPVDLYKAYNFEPLLNAGIRGQNTNIAIAARTDFEIEDVRKYRQQFGLPPKDPIKLFPLGPVANRGGIEETEVLLDSQLAGAAAPDATIQVVIAQQLTDSIQLIYNNFSSIPLVSISFGLCEQRLTAETTRFFDMLYLQGVLQGQTTFVASGDRGVNDCFDGQLSVNGLASSPNAVCVGGTRLDPQFDSEGRATGYGGEQVWNSGGATGGGISVVFSKPTYQFGPGVPVDNKRYVPDISLLADPVGPGYFIVKGGDTFVIGGTSASAPVWAAILGLVSQANQLNAVGNLNFRLYPLGGNQFNGGAKVYNDVTVGNNSTGGLIGYTAQVGYDLATGWGSVDVNSLARNFLQQVNNLAPVRNLQAAVTTQGVQLNWQEPEIPASATTLTTDFATVLSLEDITRELDSRWTTISSVSSGRTSLLPELLTLRDEDIQPLATGRPPEITNLTARIRGKNKAQANFVVADPDGNLGGNNAGISIVLFDRNLQPVTAPRNGSILPFRDREVFSPPLQLGNQTRSDLSFTLKGVKNFPSAAIWASNIRDDAGNLALAPATSGIAGRITSFGAAPQILRANSAIFQQDDTVGVNLDATDIDADTVGISVAFLDADANVAFALGLIGEAGLRNFIPIPLEMVRNPVRGQTNFNINFAISGIAAVVSPGTLRSVAVSLVDSAGNRSLPSIITFGSRATLNGLRQYHIYRSDTSPVLLIPQNRIAVQSSAITSFIDPAITNSQPVKFYVVTAVYDRGESTVSNEVSTSKVSTGVRGKSKLR